MDVSRNRGTFPSSGNSFSCSPKCPNGLWESQQPPFQWILFVKWQKHETDRSPISNTEVKYEWRCKSIPLPHLLSLYEQSCHLIMQQLFKIQQKYALFCYRDKRFSVFCILCPSGKRVKQKLQPHFTKKLNFFPEVWL